VSNISGDLCECQYQSELDAFRKPWTASVAANSLHIASLEHSRETVGQLGRQLHRVKTEVYKAWGNDTVLRLDMQEAPVKAFTVWSCIALAVCWVLVPFPGSPAMLLLPAL
jgi:hypothetical protein